MLALYYFHACLYTTASCMLITHIQLEHIIFIIVNDVHAIYMCDLSVMLVLPGEGLPGEGLSVCM